MGVEFRSLVCYLGLVSAVVHKDDPRFALEARMERVYIMLTESKMKVHTDHWQIAEHVTKLKASIIREILKISSKPGVINFAGGLPAPELFPLDDINEAMSTAISNFGADSVQYSISQGILPLRELLAERATARGTKSDATNIQITSGSQQGIELIARAFIEPGDHILVENPTYVGALQAFNYYRARYCTVEMDADGMIIDQVRAMIEKHRPKLIYTVSNFQNPTGITMSEERRRALVDVAMEYDIPIIDDNPYGDIRFSGEHVPTLKSYGGDEVIALRTFSKVLAPGMRVGWMNGPADIMPQFEKVKQCTDLHTNTIGQALIYEYVKAGKLEPHIEEVRKSYRGKRNLMVETMKATFPEGVRWTEPEGGLFLWVELPVHMSANDLFSKAIERQVAYVWGEPFFANGGGKNTLRLNFATASLEDIEIGIGRLAVLLNENI